MVYIEKVYIDELKVSDNPDYECCKCDVAIKLDYSKLRCRRCWYLRETE
jgi:hypothetical protein